jgi:hypothetical protein
MLRILSPCVSAFQDFSSAFPESFPVLSGLPRPLCNKLHVENFSFGENDEKNTITTLL